MADKALSIHHWDPDSQNYILGDSIPVAALESLANVLISETEVKKVN